MNNDPLKARDKSKNYTEVLGGDILDYRKNNQIKQNLDINTHFSWVLWLFIIFFFQKIY